MVRLISFVFVVSLVTSFWANNMVEDEREALWKQVAQDIQKGLPKSAVANLQKIFDSAMADEAIPEATYAYARKLFVEGQIDQPVAPYVIRKLQAESDTLPQQIRPVAKVMLAKWYFAYFQQNRWRFSQRSQTASVPGEDFETWDLNTILKQIDQLFRDALASSETLKSIPISEYELLTVEGTSDDGYRPTLYDFVAFQALEFYSLDEQFIRQQGAFSLTADSPIFASADQFLAWTPETEDEDSYLLVAVKLFQDLLRFHKDDEDKAAFLDADRLRLLFANGAVSGDSDEKTARYQAAMRRFADKHVAHPLSSMALSHLATSLYSQEKFVEALTVAETGVNRFPDSQGGKICFGLIESIKQPTIQLTSERQWHADKASIDLTYKNLQTVHFRLVNFDYENWSEWGQHRSPQYQYRTQRGSAGTIAKEWQVDLPSTDDYKVRQESLPVDVDLASGCYLLLASTDGNFSHESNRPQYLAVNEVWVSNLSVVIRRGVEIDGNARATEALVLDSTTGEPVEGVQVTTRSWIRNGRNSSQSPATNTQTDANGRVFLGRNNSYSKLEFQHNGQRLGLVDRFYSRNWNTTSDYNRLILFTDRSIYRPGQAVQFKGIMVRSSHGFNDYQTLPNMSVDLQFMDANRQQIETRTFRTNEFGSFSGTFTAPRDRATGSMSLVSTFGTAVVRVEEYKRPKFLVEVDKPKEAFQLGQKVKIEGNATAYTGAPIDGAKVTWRVVRTVRYPYWCTWRYWYLNLSSNSQEIANGTTTTDVKGQYQLEFPALPDTTVDRRTEPIFNYAIYVDVTDTTGETRSSQQTTSVGYTSLEAKITGKQWQTTDQDVKLSLLVTTLDGEGQEANGTLKIYNLKSPDQVQPAALNPRWRVGTDAGADLSKINAWSLGDSIAEQELSTDGAGKAKFEVRLAAGAYRAVFETNDPAGNKVTSEFPIVVHDPDNDQFGIKIPSYFQTKSDSVEPGQEFQAVWATGYDSGRAFVEFEHRGKVIKSFWTESGATQQMLRFPIEESHRGGIQLRVTYVRENRAYIVNQAIDVPWSNKKLTVKWEHFVSKLTPGGKETWTAVVSGPGAEKSVAEMVAGLYDASLDAFLPHNWVSAFNVFYRNYSPVGIEFSNRQTYFNVLEHNFNLPKRSTYWTYRAFNPEIGLNGNRLHDARKRLRSMAPSPAIGGGATPEDGQIAQGDFALEGNSTEAEANKSTGFADGRGGQPAKPGVDLEQVSARTNLQETAFFFPHLTVDESGQVKIEFEIPEALTTWNFFGFAHDNELKAALLKDTMITSKDLMVQPNPPRFLREGDLLEFSVKVTNRSDDAQSGEVRLTFADARTGQSVDQSFGNQTLDQAFEIPAQESRSLFWKIRVPDFVGVLTYKAVGATETVSDGEEGFLPVLSKRILVTESLPLPIRGNQTKQFDFERLKLAGESDSLQNQTLTVQVTSNPAWYAVLSLPYLMEYPHECSEQTFNRLYANALGKHIVSSDPKIEMVFEQWRGTDALDSPLEKNDDLRNVLIAESPWLLAGKKESQARRDVGILFDQNRLNNELRSTLNKLVQMQYTDGSWPWFPGGRANDYITLYITTGFGRLRHLGVEVDMAAAIKAVDRLDWWVDKRYKKILSDRNVEQNNLSPDICLYLYGRSFFLDDKPVDAKYKDAFDFWVGQAKAYSLELKNRQSQGHLAIGLKRIGDRQTANNIMASLTERSLQDEELGMFWREGDLSWWWYKAPIETQALMIEAYDEVAGDAEKVEELKIWLLKQKQTQNWKTTKATADACYGLLLKGTNLLASDNLVKVSLGGTELKPQDVEVGTGFYEQKFVRAEIQPEMGQIEMVKSDEGVAWGSIHWQYLEDVSKIEPYEGTPLTLKKKLFIKKNTDQGPVISEVDGPVEVGDELVMRVELRVDRAMEYVHLKDYRGSGTEPVNVLSQYKFQDGLAYYESTKDTASHFFIDYLPRGTYVFEYSVRVQHRGEYETGIAELQCMYAPEFNSHSGSVKITVE